MLLLEEGSRLKETFFRGLPLQWTLLAEALACLGTLLAEALACLGTLLVEAFACGDTE